MTITVNLFLFWISMIIVFGVVWFCKDLAMLNIGLKKQQGTWQDMLDADDDAVTDFDQHITDTPGMQFYKKD